MKYLIAAITFTLIACESMDNSILEKPGTHEAPFVDSINQHYYTLYSDDFVNAEKQTLTAIRLSHRNQWADREALAQKNYAIIQYMMGNYETSLSAAHRAYDLFDSIQDKSGLARVCNEMGNFYRKQGATEKALEMWETAESLAIESGDLEALGTSYGMRGTFYWIQKAYETSDEFYLKCYRIRLDEKDSVGMGYVLIDLADMEQRKGNLAAAIDYFKQSNAIRTAIKDHQGLVDNYKMMGDLWMNEINPKEAIPYYQACAAHCSKLKYPDLKRKSYDSLASAFSLLGNYQSAFQYQRQADSLEDSLYSIEKARAITELQTKYETAKKEKELVEKKATIKERNLLTASLGAGIILLLIIGLQVVQRQKITHQKQLETEHRKSREAQIEAVINSQEKERSRFAKDLHDGFGQMISILNLNLRSLELGDKDKHEVFESSSQVLEEMYQELKGICFNLMPQTLIKHGISAALNEFASRINQTNQIAVTTDFFGLEDRLSDVEEISLYRISQEWVNNIIKYSDAQKVNIQITRDDYEITLLIEDDGLGFDAKLLRSGKGNGWRNMTTRANFIGGELELDTTPGNRGNTLIVNAKLTMNQFVAAHSTQEVV